MSGQVRRHEQPSRPDERGGMGGGELRVDVERGRPRVAEGAGGGERRHHQQPGRAGVGGRAGRRRDSGERRVDQQASRRRVRRADPRRDRAERRSTVRLAVLVLAVAAALDAAAVNDGVTWRLAVRVRA
jgi:hypothetical protein